MHDVITLVLSGIGGYGNSYVSALFDSPEQRDYRVVGAVDPAPTSCRRLGDLKSRHVPIYPTLDAFYATNAADLCVICSPLQYHAQQTVLALSHGSHVLCEKPLCVTPDQAMAMIRARNRTKKQVAIGYQWSFSAAMQRLKADIMDGRFGRPKRLRSLVLWPRDETYYGRNSWAGAKEDVFGNIVLDSPINNACAHYLHNLFYILGPRVDRSAQPASVTAELYRAHEIENYDTAALRAFTTAGTEIFLVVSHSIAERRGPIFKYEFERATVQFGDKPGDTITANFTDGTTADYGSPNHDNFAKLWSTIRAVRDNRPTICGIEAALPHTLCAFAAQQSVRDIATFPSRMVNVEGLPGARRTWVEGLSDTLQQCFAEGKMPSEMGYDWAVRGDEIPIASMGLESDSLGNQKPDGSAVGLPEYR